MWPQRWPASAKLPEALLCPVVAPSKGPAEGTLTEPSAGGSVSEGTLERDSEFESAGSAPSEHARRALALKKIPLTVTLGDLPMPCLPALKGPRPRAWRKSAA